MSWLNSCATLPALMADRYSNREFRRATDFVCIPAQTGAASLMIITFELPEPAGVPRCATCRCAMHLAGIEWETETLDLYTFGCRSCDAVETRSVTVQ
jgi:hypothetical protein